MGYLACEQAHLFGDVARLSWRPFASRRAKRAGERNGASESEPARKPLYFEFRPLRGDKLPLSTKQSSNQSKSINTTETCTWKVSRQIAQLSMDRSVTRKKVVDKPSDYCRVCNCTFSVKYGTGKSGRISTENLFQPSNRDGSRGCVLASMCEKIGIPLVKAPSLSERVCDPCARKIRNVSKLFNDLKEATSVDGAGVKNARSKRQLPTSVLTPDRSPANT